MFKVFSIRQLYVKTHLFLSIKVSIQFFKKKKKKIHTQGARTCGAMGMQFPQIAKSFLVTNSDYIANILFRIIPSGLKSPLECSENDLRKHVIVWLQRAGLFSSQGHCFFRVQIASPLTLLTRW